MQDKKNFFHPKYSSFSAYSHNYNIPRRWHNQCNVQYMLSNEKNIELKHYAFHFARNYSAAMAIFFDRIGSFFNDTSPSYAVMKKFVFFNGSKKYELELTAIEKNFESYLLFKARTEKGIAWLKEFQKGGLQTIALVMHFLYDKDWIDNVVEEQEDELIHMLSPVKLRVFNELFKY